MKKLIPLTGLSLLLLGPGLLFGPEAEAQSHGHVYVPIDSSYHLIFDEEFSGASLDQTKWTPHWFGAKAGLITQPVNPYPVETATYEPAQVTVSGGHLHLEAVSKSISIGGAMYPYRTGFVSTNGKFQFTYG